MRKGFMSQLTRLAQKDDRIWLLIGDTGFGLIEEFQNACPDRYINVGIAEQSIAGLAAGLALAGKIPFFYAIGNFATLRCLEQIRNDICYQQANVKIVTSGGGLAYGPLGMSHHVTEDLAVMRALQDIVVMAPGDPIEAHLATLAAYEHTGPVYMRLGRTGETKIHEPNIKFEVGKAIWVKDGADLTLISTGGMLATAVEVASRLAGDGVDAGVVSMHTLRPIDVRAVEQAAERSAGIVTLEEHVLQGGLGSAVAEVLCDQGVHTRLTRIGLPPGFVRGAGSHQFLKSCAGLDIDSIYIRIKAALSGDPAVR